MIDENCIFCKILAWQIPWVKIRENDEFVAILDAFPNRKWMTLLITKNHIDSDILSKDDKFIARYFQTAKKVANILKKWLKVDRVGIAVEWLEVNHAHIKLYPFFDWVWFANWIWSWPQATLDELNAIAKEIKNNQ